MPRPIQQRRLDLLRLGTLRQNHLIRLFLLFIGIQINNPDPNLQIIQQRHDLNLICLFVHLLDLHLAEDVDWKLVVDECLVEK